MRNLLRLLCLISFAVLSAFQLSAQDTIVAWNFPNNPDDATADGGKPVNLTRIIDTRGGTSAVDFMNAGFTTNAANASGWNNGANTKYWLISFNTSGYTTVNLSSKQRSSNIGPKDFRIQYTLDTNTAWTDVPGGTITVANNWVSGFVNNLALPQACCNQPMVYLRYIMTDSISVTGGIVAPAGTNKIDDILLIGTTSYVPVYASFPYLMTFDSLWVNGNAVKDVPSGNWLNVPDSGDNSWRREDDASQFTWVGGDYTPSGAIGTPHSARFHTYGAGAGTAGNLDLYINLSPAGYKTLRFYYINTGGTDFTNVLFSTNGGSTFSPLGMLTNAAYWTKYSFALGSVTSPACIIRFRATSDFGWDDIGLDEVSVDYSATDDAGIAVITSPGLLINAGSYPINVAVENFGTSNLTSASIHWSVNGLAQTPVPWTGNLATLAVDNTVTLGNYNFTSGNYFMKVWTESPNGNADGDHANDTAYRMSAIISFASVPFHEGFENNWINKNDTADVPSIYWNNMPPAGDDSWRRDDEGPLGNWTDPNGAMYNPAGAIGTAHSARFHTWYAPNGTSGSLDLYVDFTPVGGKVLSYYTINTDGLDSLVVLFSADGGLTFNHLATHFVNSVWTKYTFNLGASNSPGCIVRFIGNSDYGYTDIGLDEVDIALTGPDVAMVQLMHPVSGCGLGSNEPVVIKVANNGPSNVTNLPVSYNIDGNQVNEIIPGPIIPGSWVNYTFSQTANLSVPGIHHCVCITHMSNDTDHSNDTLRMDITNAININSFPFLENFESGNDLYFLLQSGPNAAIAIKHGAGNQSATGLLFTGETQGTWPPGTSTSTTAADAWNTYTAHHADASTCIVDATSLSHPELMLDLRQEFSAGPLYSWFRVLVNDTVQLISTDGVINFNPVSPNADPWKMIKFDMSAYGGQIFKLTLQSSCKYDSVNANNGDKVLVDNIVIRQKPLNDMAMIRWISPLGGECGMPASDTVRVKVANEGLNSQHNIPVQYSVDNGTTWVTDTIHNTLNPGDTLQFSFSTPADFSTPNNYQCVARTALTGDNDPMNDVLGFMLMSVPTISAYPYYQNFEPAFTGWTSNAIAGMDQWQIGMPNKPNFNNTHSGTHAWVTKLAGNYDDFSNCYVLSPCFDFTSLVNPHLSLWLNINTEQGWDGMVMETSVNDSTWVQFPGDTIFYNNNQAMGPVVPPKWSGNSNGWRQFKTALTGFAGLNKVRIRFRFQSDQNVNSEGIALDDIFISDPLPIDAAVVGLISPYNGCTVAGQDTVKINVNNAGTDPIFNIPVSYSVNGNTWVHNVVTATIQPNQTIVYTFPVPIGSLASGMNIIKLAVALSGDLDPSNDTLQAFVLRLQDITALPFNENFDAVNNYFDLKQDVNSGVNFLNGSGYMGSNALFFTGGTAGTWPGGTALTTAASDAWGTYTDHHAQAATCSITVSSTNSLFLKFLLRQTHSGSGPKYSWFRVVANGTTQLTDINGVTDFNPFTAINDSFYTVMFDLTTYAGSSFTISLQSSNKYNATNATNGVGDNAYIDNLAIFDTVYNGIALNSIPFPLCYPNPTTGKVFVNFNALVKQGTLELFDINGRLALKEDIAEKNNAQIDLAGLPKALYCLVIRTDNSVSLVKILKQ